MLLIKTLRTVPYVLVLMVAGPAGDSANGQDRKEGPPHAVLINDVAETHPISAYVEPSTMLVAEIDWQTIDVDPLFELIQELTGDRPSDVPTVKQLFGAMKEAQAGKVYFLAGLETPADKMPLIVIETPQATKLLAAIENTLGKRPASVTALTSNRGMILGTTEQIKRVQSSAPIKRDALLMPLKDANRLDHTAVMVLPPQTRELLTSVWPQRIPGGLPLKLSPSELVQGIDRVILTFRTPPDPLVRLMVDATDEASADRFAKQFAGVKQAFGESLQNVSLRREKHRVILEAGEDVFRQGRSLATDARERARQSQLVDSLKQLGLAFYIYHDREKHLPPRCFVDPDGKPLHSWLVAVLPDLNNLAFYRSIRLDLPWDAAENSQMKRTVPAGIGDSSLPVAHTVIRAPVFPGSLWHGDGPPKTLQDITDDRSQTILLVEAAREDAIHWADPTPWVISETNPMEDLFAGREAMRVLLADGSVLLLKRSDVDNAKLKAMLTIAAGD
ncbi:DUF1559 family PulG-like putative transporter [Stieleria mannarensis]|uniref:DUF1559 family PulG-like putative transporter n=1 Tax=Stieleria mannarensis TaxID=2755585 RepID=UPI0016021D5A|nr:DUF1559 domain-containing protein [Rhodopirellula sp. JC639]